MSRELTFDEIRKVFGDLRDDLPPRSSAVLVPMMERDGELCLLFQVRAKTLRSQPGEIAFPGGRIDAGETPREAAVRETMEELNVRREDIELIGPLVPTVAPSRSIIYPFVGILHSDVLDPSPDEVDHVFTVPLSQLMQADPIRGEMEWQIKPGKTVPVERMANREAYVNRRFEVTEHFYEHENYLIWGLTARILRQFLHELR